MLLLREGSDVERSLDVGMEMLVTPSHHHVNCCLQAAQIVEDLERGGHLRLVLE